MGGYVKYFTDLPATNGYPMTVVFPQDDDMTMINQGAFGMVKELPHEGDGFLATIGQLLRAMFGYTSNPEWITLLSLLAYVVVVMFLYLRPVKPAAPKPVAENQPATGS